jgi:signal transduction histidine kinase
MINRTIMIPVMIPFWQKTSCFAWNSHERRTCYRLSRRTLFQLYPASADEVEMPKAPKSTVRQRSSIESFLDEYQKIRFYLNLGGLALISAILLGGWWKAGSPAPFFVAMGVMASHAAWCRIDQIRAPKAMLVVDSTMVGLMMLTSSADPAGMTATVAFIALLVVLFSEGRWMAGLLAYNATLLVVASIRDAGATAESLGSLSGAMFTVGAIVVVMYKVRRWLGRLDANRSQMVGTVSHELRNNLTGMVGLADVVMSMSDLQPTEAHELITMAHQQALDATEIVEDLLTASRLEGAALSLSAGEVDVNEEVTDTARRFRGAGTEVALTLGVDLQSAWADALRTRQIIRNLLSNAIRYGGPEIQIATRGSDQGIQITVADNGEGVPSQDEGTIFLPYRRSTKGRRDASSVGLGLWICRQLAHGMGGSLDYQRRDEQTEFILTLPIAKDEAERDAAGAEASSSVTVTSEPSRATNTMSGALAVT